MKLVLAGGIGYLGRMLTHFFLSKNYQVVILSRNTGKKNQESKKNNLLPTTKDIKIVYWNTCCDGDWMQEINGADVVINLSGENIKCLFTDNNLQKIKKSRVLSTQAIGKAIQKALHPPALWIQMSSVTIYPHSVSTPYDETSISPLTNNKTKLKNKVPLTWLKMEQLIQDWEQATYSINTKQTRKVIIRCSIIMSAEKHSAFDIFCKLTKWRLGGSVAGGKQYISWMHAQDFVQAIHFVIQNQNIKGPINFTAPKPLRQKDFMTILRKKLKVKIALPATKWMIYLSSQLTQIDPELVLKSRYVLPKVLLDKGFVFKYPDWKMAVDNLITTDECQ